MLIRPLGCDVNGTLASMMMTREGHRKTLQHSARAQAQGSTADGVIVCVSLFV